MNPSAVGIAVQARDNPTNYPTLEIFGQSGSWMVMIETGSLEIAGLGADEQMVSIVLGSITRGVWLRNHPLGCFWQMMPPNHAIREGEEEKVELKVAYPYFEGVAEQAIPSEVFELQFWV